METDVYLPSNDLSLYNAIAAVSRRLCSEFVDHVGLFALVDSPRGV